MPSQRIVLIRHGETAWSLEGRYTGTTDIPLTDNGRSAAQRLRPVLARQPFALVLTSPRDRARTTCALAGLGEHAQIDPDLAEWNYGAYEGLTIEQIQDGHPEWMVFRDGCPGGESPAQIGARIDRVLDRVRSTDGDVALFAHGHLSRALMARWIGLPASAGQHFLLDTATVNILGYYRDAPAVQMWNAPLVW